MVDYESSTPEGSKLATANSVSGYPTVMLMDKNSNKIKDYTGDRTEAALLSFLKANK